MEKYEISREGLLSFVDQGIGQAMERHKLKVAPETSRYLTTMLARFAETTALFPDKNSGTWLEPLTIQCHRITEETNLLQRRNQQQQLGEHCLFLVGYFYDFLRRHGEANVRYYSSIGSTAYQQTGRAPFVEVGQKFTDLYLVIGDLHLPQIDEKRLVEIYERWEKTKDKYYASLLLGKGIVPREIKIANN
ncbi:MAG: hypothetical protein Q8R47_02735 [Nanoarchaeota archaeon]|nr:hypothetical protein [Nanoarchaeota archaeon]